jgi:hypothetical protein
MHQHLVWLKGRANRLWEALLKDQIKNPEYDQQADQENDPDNPTQNLEHICLRCLR